MSLSLVQSRALLGLEAASVTVEVHLANGLPSFTLVGLVETEVKEARVSLKICGAQQTQQNQQLRRGKELFFAGFDRAQSCARHFLRRFLKTTSAGQSQGQPPRCGTALAWTLG